MFWILYLLFLSVWGKIRNRKWGVPTINRALTMTINRKGGGVMPALSVSKLSMSFGERTLFEDMSFEVESRDKVGLIGRNGVGKTTLFKII